MTQMMDDADLDRRTVLRGVGTLAVAGAGALAGCGGSGGGSGGGGSDGGGGGGSGGSDGGDSGGGGVSDDAQAQVDEYLSDVGNYDGSIEDMTGTGNVEVAVGAEGNGGAFAFAPPAVRIDAGTTVVWGWTGDGGQHNVVAENGDFESSLTGEAGNNFQYTFEETGVYRYFCQPHKGVGMKGAVVVV